MYKLFTSKKLHVLKVIFKGCAQFFYSLFSVLMRTDAHERSNRIIIISLAPHT